MKIDPKKIAPATLAKIAAGLGETRPQAAVGHNGKKTEGRTPLSGCEIAFSEAWTSVGGAILAKEPLALAVGGGVYTPDFLCVDADGEPCMVECKSAHALPNEGRARAKFEEASRRNPQVVFVWAVYDSDGGFGMERWKGGKCVSR